jgi:hypothetical protein
VHFREAALLARMQQVGDPAAVREEDDEEGEGGGT